MSHTFSPCRPKVRPRFQQAFFRWLEECHGQFATPLRLLRRTDKTIEIAFPELSAYISVLVRPMELSVCVTKDGEFVDYLLNIDLKLERNSQGYFCEFCDPEQRAYFSSREQAWRSHQFEPFLAWITTELAPAKWLRIFRNSEGSSGASLICDETDLNRVDPGMRLLAGLKRLDGQSMHRVGIDDFEIWEIPLNAVKKEVHYHAMIDSELAACNEITNCNSTV